MRDRFKGALLGLIVGDALGAPYEGSPRDSVYFQGEMRGGGPHKISAGHWTDDSSMALCLAESLIKDGFDLKSQLSKYANWFQNGYLSSKERSFGIGRNTSLSITDYIKDKSIPPQREMAAGNGSIMRLAPVPMYFFNNFNKAVYYSGKSSKATHNNPMAIDTCKLLGAFIYYALEGKEKKYLINNTYKNLDLDENVLERVQGDYKNKTKDQINSDGFVLNTIEASLWAFYNSKSFEEAVTIAINLGGDTDTIAAVTGQMAGAFYGSSEIPDEWINKLAKKELIMSLIRGLYQSGNH
ncbi:MAG TPA: ADP-ribosylglycohydrolase family protein [Halanaerobiales bacterium]|nr:ADP-ribosylglycohydrolase family protein [Halanaerobiales bacterium]